MSMTWAGDAPPPHAPPGLRGWLRVARRATAMVVTILLGLTLLLPLRLIEGPVFGLHRPWTPWITQAVCRLCLVWMGFGFHRSGRPMKQRGAIVANHSSWLDIFVLNASDRVHFVSKSEVAGWPGIGPLARATGTLFIARDPRQARHQAQLFEERLMAGQRLLFFPEGTSTDGLRVLPFKTTLFAPFFAETLHDVLHLQPVTVIYHAPAGTPDPRTYGWWGDMSFGAHLLSTLALPRQGRVEVVYHTPLRAADYDHRKKLAAAAETRVRAAHVLAADDTLANPDAIP